MQAVITNVKERVAEGTTGLYDAQTKDQPDFCWPIQS